MSPPCILVTGFPTSFLALRVVRKLLRDTPDSRLRLVVQSKSLERARELLADMEGATPGRVHVLEGDAASIDMGLSGAEWVALSGEVNIIHHCMAVTYLGAEREFATAANVGGIREAVELAEAAPNFERLVHWSSALGAASGSRST